MGIQIKHKFNDLARRVLLTLNGDKDAQTSSSSKLSCHNSACQGDVDIRTLHNLTNVERLKNFQHSIESYISESEDDKYRLADIFVFAKIVANSILFHQQYAVLSADCDSFSRINNNLSELVHSDLCNALVDETFEVFSNSISIKLSKLPVIALPWSRSRLFDILANINPVSNPWIQDDGNHRIDLYLPMGTAVAVSGNHSISTGVAKNIGEIAFGRVSDTELPRRRIFDMSPLYGHVYFDGDSFVEYNTKREVIKNACFEMGLLYEFGRIVQKYGISFFDYVNDK